MRIAHLLAAALFGSSLSVVATAGAPAAAAVTNPVATSTFVCTFPILGDVEVPLSLDVADLPETLPTGIPLQAGAIDVDGLLEIPDLAVLLMLLNFGQDAVTGTPRNLALDLGGVPVPVALGSTLTNLPLGGLLDLPLTGATGAFTPGLPGQVPLTLPETFDLGFGGEFGQGLFSAPCALQDEEPATVGAVRVTKQKASMKGRVLTKPVKKGKRAKVHVSVWDEVNRGVAGRVVATVKGRRVGQGTLKGGALRMKISKLRVGKHRVKLNYQGTDTVDKAVKRVTVKVVKRKKKS